MQLSQNSEPHVSQEIETEVAQGRGAVSTWSPPQNHKGDRVAALLPLMGSRWGAMAQFAPVNWRYVAAIPKDLSLRDAASVPLVGLTTLQALDNLVFNEDGTGHNNNDDDLHGTTLHPTKQTTDQATNHEQS